MFKKILLLVKKINQKFTNIADFFTSDEFSLYLKKYPILLIIDFFYYKPKYIWSILSYLFEYVNILIVFNYVKHCCLFGKNKNNFTKNTIIFICLCIQIYNFFYNVFIKRNNHYILLFVFKWITFLIFYWKLYADLIINLAKAFLKDDTKAVDDLQRALRHFLIFAWILIISIECVFYPKSWMYFCQNCYNLYFKKR